MPWRAETPAGVRITAGCCGRGPEADVTLRLTTKIKIRTENRIAIVNLSERMGTPQNDQLFKQRLIQCSRNRSRIFDIARRSCTIAPPDHLSPKCYSQGGFNGAMRVLLIFRQEGVPSSIRGALRLRYMACSSGRTVRGDLSRNGFAADTETTFGVELRPKIFFTGGKGVGADDSGSERTIRTVPSKII